MSERKIYRNPKEGTGTKHQGYSLAEILDPSRITRLSFPCEPAPEELEELHILEDMRTCDGKTVDAYFKELGELVHGLSQDCDDAMASVFMIDSLGPLVEKKDVKKKIRKWHLPSKEYMESK